MQASREFIDPRTDPPRFVAVEVPRGAGFTIQSGPWGGPLDDERRALEDPVEAIKAHIAAVGELLDVGFVELGPWLVVTHDPERVRVRPPMTRFFETRRGDEVRREDCGTVKGALAAFEAWLGQRPDDRLEAPPWGEVDVDTGLYGEHAEHFEDDPAAVQRRYYQRKAAPHDEFGPELWLFPSGATRQAVTQLLARHLPRLRAFLRLRLSDRALAKDSVSDFVQSVCRECLVEADAFEYRSEAAFRHWLFTLALRKVQDRARYWHAQRRSVDREQSLSASSISSASITARPNKWFMLSRRSLRIWARRKACFRSRSRPIGARGRVCPRFAVSKPCRTKPPASPRESVTLKRAAFACATKRCSAGPTNA